MPSGWGYLEDNNIIIGGVISKEKSIPKRMHIIAIYLLLSLQKICY